MIFQPNELGSLASVAVFSGLTSFGGAVTLLQNPIIGESTLVPLGVVVGLATTCVLFTAKVVDLLNNIDRRIDENARRLDDIDKKLE